MEKTKTVDQYLQKVKNWQLELIQLRKIVLKSGLEEGVKWGGPIYMQGGKNIVGIGSFKSYFGLWFFQGALLSDKANVLINAQEGTTKAQRQWRFNSLEEVDETLILTYIKEAVQHSMEGKVVKHKTKPLIIPDELENVFKINPALKERFDQFSLTDKRDFTEYISVAKRQETKQTRLLKVIGMIEANVGLNDKYK